MFANPSFNFVNNMASFVCCWSCICLSAEPREGQLDCHFGSSQKCTASKHAQHSYKTPKTASAGADRECELGNTGTKFLPHTPLGGRASRGGTILPPGPSQLLRLGLLYCCWGSPCGVLAVFVFKHAQTPRHVVIKWVCPAALCSFLYTLHTQQDCACCNGASCSCRGQWWASWERV